MKGLNICNKVLEELNEGIVDYRYYSVLNDHSNLVAYAISKKIPLNLSKIYEDKVCKEINKILFTV